MLTKGKVSQAIFKLPLDAKASTLLNQALLTGGK